MAPFEQSTGLADPQQVSEAILESVQEAVILTGLDLRVQRWSRGAERQYGWARDEALGRPVHELIRPDLAPEEMQAIAQRVLAAGQVTLTDKRRRKDGSWLIAAASFTVLADGQGRPAGILSVTRDVTSSEEGYRLVRAGESRLREAQLHLARHLENTPLAVIEWDGDYRICAFGGRASEMFGWTAPEVLGRRVDEVPWVPEADWPIVRAAMSDLADRQRPVKVTANRNLRKDGAVIHCEWHNSALYDAEGRLASVFSLVQDVTDRVQAETALRRSEARLTRVLEGSTDGYFELDIASGRMMASDRVLLMLGLTPVQAEPVLQAWLARIHPEELAQTLAQLQELLEGRAEQMDVQGRARHADGTWRWLRTRARRFVGADGAATLAGTVTDVTGSRAAEEAVRQANASNEQLVQELREALASVKTLSGLIPLCMYCKKVRDDAGYWERLESYITKHSGALVSHGICPECTKKHFPEDG